MQKTRLVLGIKLEKTAFVRNLIKNQKLAGHIDKAIGSGEFDWRADFNSKHGDDGWHPSGDCLPSANSLYHKALNADDPLVAKSPHPVSLLKTFQVGHFWHAYIQYVVVNILGFATDEDIECRGYRGWGSEVKTRYFGVNGDGTRARWKPYHYATGSADIAPCRIPVHGDYLVDIKTMGAHDYRQNGLPRWCASKYEAQINIYMDLFDLEHAIILCVSKDSPHDFKEFEFNRNQPLIDAIYSKWKLVGQCIEDGVEPPEAYDVALPITGPRL